jgi:hypothetical protein
VSLRLRKKTRSAARRARMSSNTNHPCSTTSRQAVGAERPAPELSGSRSLRRQQAFNGFQYFLDPDKPLVSERQRRRFRLPRIPVFPGEPG